MKIAVIVVVFNEKIDDYINKFSGVYDLYFFDNSIDETIIAENINKNNCFSNNGNIGLSKSYNLAIEKFRDTHDYLMILDDDTIIPQGYLEELKKLISENPDIDIFSPKIISAIDKKIKYPIYFGGNILLNKLRLDRVEKNMKSINSGLVLKLDKSTILFDEKLFLYGVDFKYFDDIVNYKKIKYVDIALYQNFSKESKSKKEILRRAKLELRDAKLYYSRKNFLINYAINGTIYLLRFKSFDYYRLIIKNRKGNR